MADSVGQIGLDLIVNRNGFDRQMGGIQSLAKKAGAALAGAFAIKKLVDFGKACIDLGSQLAEVDNVIQQAVPSMEKQIDSFAKNAIQQFGMSETLAKRYVGVFSSMARGFGFSEESAASMGTTLTGLAADVASFYDTSQDEAFTKLKGIFTGETEALKGLGIVMTQAALDAYALANGYKKTTKSMSEAEKVALRYAYVQDQLKFATGDFARTSGSWANQVRILNEQFNALKATIGQGLINLFTPIIRVVNALIGKLATLANAFKAFTELITGNKASDGVSGVGAAAGAAANDLSSATDAADSLSDATAGAGKAAKKAAKEMKGLSGIDKLNNITSNDSSSGSGGGSGGAAGGSIDFGSLATGETVLDEQNKKFSALIERVKELGELFKKGFKIGLGDTSVLGSIQESISKIKDSFTNIFTDGNVLGAAARFADSIAVNLGKVSGSVASIGLTIADNLLGGISKYLESNTDKIKQYLIDMFDIGADISRITGDFSAAIADVFTVFRSDSAKGITADIISIFADSFMNVTLLAGKFMRDMLDCLTAPFIKNKDKLKITLQGILDAARPITEGISNLVSNTWAKIQQTYDEHVKPMIDSFRDGFTEIFGILLDGYNQYILPVLQGLGEKVSSVFSEHVQPAIDNFLELIGLIADGIKDIWEKTIKPFYKWIAKNIYPVVAPILKMLGTAFLDLCATVTDVFSGIIDVAKGVVTFFTGVFTGDWKKALDGIKQAVNGWKTAVSNLFSGTWTMIKNIFTPITSWFKEKFDGAYAKVKNAFSGTRDYFEGIWSNIKAAFGNIPDWFKTEFTKAWTKVKDVFSKGGRIFDGIKDGILNGLKAVINGLIGGINKVIAKPFKGLNSAIDKIKSVEVMGLKPFSGLGNIDIPEIPKLAKGGFVKANTPQLAMIGDNRHQGEVVAPEGKLKELLDEATKARPNQDLSILIGLMKQIIELLKAIYGKEYMAYVKSSEIMKGVMEEYKRLKSITGRPVFN